MKGFGEALMRGAGGEALGLHMCSFLLVDKDSWGRRYKDVDCVGRFWVGNMCWGSSKVFDAEQNWVKVVGEEKIVGRELRGRLDVSISSGCWTVEGVGPLRVLKRLESSY